VTFPAPLHSVAQDQEAAEVQRVLARQLGRRAITVFRATLNSDQETIQKMGEFRVGADLWMLTCPVFVSLSGLHRLRSAADARVHHRRATEHHPGRVDVPVLLLNPDACAYVTDITPNRSSVRAVLPSHKFGVWLQSVGTGKQSAMPQS